MERKILLGVTGSVAAVLAAKLIKGLQELGEVRVVFTDSGKYFVDHDIKAQQAFHAIAGSLDFYTDEDEWTNIYAVGDPIKHIELRKWADVLVLAPLSANTLAKVTHGICDNLLTSVVRAWDDSKPVVVAPSMNTMMWDNDITKKQINDLVVRRWTVVDPVEKTLACGDTGVGAMAPISSIVNGVKYALTCSDAF